MYFEIIAGLNPNKELTEQEKEQVKQVRDNLVLEYMSTPSIGIKRADDEITYLMEVDAGYFYRLQDKVVRPKPVYIDYFVSEIEFGAGDRKNSEDQRFDGKWKIFMMQKLKEVSPEITKQYFEDWNEQYRHFEARRKPGKAAAILNGQHDETENYCKTGERVLEDDTISV